MANKYYEPGADRAARVNDLFSVIAPRYDLINDLQSLGLHRRWKRRLVRLADPRPGERALDVCCGTGDIALALARRGAAVVGLDFSERMLAVAREKFKVQNSKLKTALNLELERGDALRIPYPDDHFDLVTIGYGLRNLTDWRAGLAEMWRVTRPGGRLLVLDFGRPKQALWRWLYLGYLRCCVPLFGRVLCGDAQAYAYIDESLRHYPAQRGVDECLQELDGAERRVVNLLGGAMSVNYARKAE